MEELIVDQERLEQYPETGIPVRAKGPTGWGSYDIAHLTRDSLFAWLRSRGGKNLFAENTLLMLFGHDQVIEAEDKEA